MDNIVREVVHVSQVAGGDTIEIDGVLRTVCQKDIHTGGFCGTSIFGMTYFPNTGYQKVVKVKFIVPTNNGVVYR